MQKIVKYLVFMTFFTTQIFANITDMAGNSFEEKEYQKLVFVGSGALRIAMYLKLENRLVGAESKEYKTPDFIPYAKKFKELNLEMLPIIGEGGPGVLPNLEAIVKVKPDLIIASTLSKDKVELLKQKTGVPVFVIDYHKRYDGRDDKLKAIKEIISKVSQITNTQKRADEILSFMDNARLDIKNLKFDRNGKFYIGGLSFKGARGLVSTEAYFPPFELLGIENIIKTKDGLNQIFVTDEAIIRANPDVIFLDMQNKEQSLKDIDAKKDIYSHINAIKNDKVFTVTTYNFRSTNAENVYIIAYEIAKFLGADVDLDGKKEQILKAFFGE